MATALAAPHDAGRTRALGNRRVTTPARDYARGGGGSGAVRIDGGVRTMPACTRPCSSGRLDGAASPTGGVGIAAGAQGAMSRQPSGAHGKWHGLGSGAGAVAPAPSGAPEGGASDTACPGIAMPGIAMPAIGTATPSPPAVEGNPHAKPDSTSTSWSRNTLTRSATARRRPVRMTSMVTRCGAPRTRRALRRTQPCPGHAHRGAVAGTTPAGRMHAAAPCVARHTSVDSSC